MRRFRLLVVLLLALWPGFAQAVQPDEVLPDAALETRARTISTELRCLVCQNQSIDDSGAQLARDLRLLVRERLKAGDTDQQVLDYLVARYGDFVLLKPPLRPETVLLWGMPVLLLGAGTIGLLLARRNALPQPPPAPLDATERAELDRLLDGAARD